MPLFLIETASHSQHIHGFKVIFHEPNANNIVQNVQKTLDRENKPNIVYLGPHQHSYEYKFKEQCIAYFARNFETLAHVDTQVLPWKAPNEIKKITDTLADWCKQTNDCTSIKGLVLHSFSILKHLHRHGFTNEMLQDDLMIENIDDLKTPIIVVYNPHESVLLLLRKAKSKKLATDILLGFHDVKLFILLFHDVLTNSGIKLIPLVVTDDKVNSGKPDCALCMNHVLSEKELTHTGTYNTWWVERETYFETQYKGEIDEGVSKNFPAKLIGVLAATLLYPHCIPKFTNKQHTHHHMEDLAVLLTPEQMDVYYSQDKHILIKGGFGCGKSIIAAAILQNISESLKEDEKLYYICYDQKSELLNQMMIKDNDKKVTPFCNKDGLELSAIIEYITETERTNKVNLVVDEYDGEGLDEAEADRLNSVFSGPLKESFVVLIAQPIEKERVINNIPQKKNKFSKLETMKKYDLTLNMRNSIEIHELVEATKAVLSEKKTVFINPKARSKKSKKESFWENPITNEIVSTPEHSQKPELERKLEFKGGLSEENSGTSKMGLDEAHAVIGLRTLDGEGGDTTESKFVYALVDKTGHKINTKKPVLFALGDEEEFCKNVSLIAIFKKVLTISSKHVVLHFDTETNAIPNVLRFAFEHYSKIPKKITTKYQEFESSKESILVCSYPTFRGLEHPIITVLIDRDIYFLQHYLVEILARCTSELYMILLNNSSTLTKVTTDWKTKELVNQWKTKIFQKDIQREDCVVDNVVDKDKNENLIAATFKSGYYKTLKEAWKGLSASEDNTIATSIEQRAKETIDLKR